jgi:hypothetical protein
VSGKHTAKRLRRTSRAPHIAGSLAVLATGAAVTAGVLASSSPSNLLAVDGTPAASAGDVTRDLVISRGGGDRTAASERQKPKEAKVEPLSPADKAVHPDAVREAISNADEQMWTTEDLNLWTRPDNEAIQRGVLPAFEKVLVTGRQMLDREEIVVQGQSRWVTSGYLSAEKPDPGPSLGGACTNGTTADSGVSAGVVAVHEAVCANWPEITSYGYFRSGDTDHATGNAVDIMISGDTGWAIAEFLRANYAEFDISYIIYSQQIWSVERSGEGWRAMEDRGSTTANHYDHVHVSTY